MLEQILFGIGVVAATLFASTAVLFGITEDRRVGVLARFFLAVILIDAVVALIFHYYFGAF